MQAQQAAQAQAQLNLQAQAAVSGAYPPLSAYSQACAHLQHAPSTRMLLALLHGNVRVLSSRSFMHPWPC